MFTAMRLLCAAISTISGGFVLSKLWLWFVVPLGALSISVPQAIGIDLMVTYMVVRPSNDTKTTKGEQITKMLSLLVYP